MSTIVVRHECQACGARWYGNAATDGAIGAHEQRWHDGAQTVWPVTAEVIEEQREDA